MRRTLLASRCRIEIDPPDPQRTLCRAHFCVDGSWAPPQQPPCRSPIGLAPASPSVVATISKPSSDCGEATRLAAAIRPRSTRAQARWLMHSGGNSLADHGTFVALTRCRREPPSNSESVAMQQIVLPSLYAPRRRPAATQPIPLVRRVSREGRAKPKPRARRFFAGVLFGVLMSATLVLLGYEARVYADQHPNLVRDTVERVTNLAR